MPLPTVITPGEDVQNNTVTLNDINELGKIVSTPDLTQYSNIVMDLRDSKRKLIAKYETGTGNKQAYNTTGNPINLVINNNQTNQLIYDIYRDDSSTISAPGELYVNVFLKTPNSDYPNDYQPIASFIVVGKATKPVK